MDFSEFEAEKDPFEQAELQTINDMQELAAVLQTTATNSFPTTSNPTYSMSSNFPYYQPYYYQQQRPQIPQYFPYNQTQQVTLLQISKWLKSDFLNDWNSNEWL